MGPTALKFLNSDKLGKQYENTMFVGNVNTGDLYNFKLSEDRTSLLLSGRLEGKVANSPEDLRSVIFGHGFGTITDLEVGPDGFLYVLTFDGNNVSNITCNRLITARYHVKPHFIIIYNLSGSEYNTKIYES